MLLSIRSAMLILATLSASSVAPAQVGSTTEPLIASSTVSVPAMVTPVPLDAPAARDLLTDDLAVDPAEQEEASDADSIEALKSKDLATLVADMRGTDPGDRQLECLAVGIYYESKGEPLIGQLAVGEVIANRAESGRFPSSYCGVLFQRGQFSFIRGKTLPTPPRSSNAWKTAVAIARIVDKDLKDSAADDALFFHATRVRPGWKKARLATIGNHVFYR